MPIYNDRFMYRAWRCDSGLVVRCVCEPLGEKFDISWEIYYKYDPNKRGFVDTCTREDAKHYLRNPHVKCGFCGEIE